MSIAPSTLEREATSTTPATSHGDGDHERFAHYVRKADALNAAVFGKAVTALCGKKWVPVKDPARFPVCPTCKGIYESIPVPPTE